MDGGLKRFLLSSVFCAPVVYSAKGKYIVRHWTSGEALRYVTAVVGGLEAFPLSMVICAPVV